MHKSIGYVECQDCSLDPLCHPAFPADSPFAIGSFNYVLDNMERRKAVSAGTPIYQQDDPVKAIYAVTSGAFKLLKGDTPESAKLSGFRFQGELLGDEALSSPIHPMSAIALSDASVCIIPIEVIQNIGKAMPEFQQAFLTLIIHQCYLAHQQLSDYVALKSADQKLAAFLMHLIKRNTLLCNDPETLQLPMSRTDIACYLGLRHETLSRTLGKFQQHDLILLRGKKITLLHRANLESLASGNDSFNLN